MLYMLDDVTLYYGNVYNHHMARTSVIASHRQLFMKVYRCRLSWSVEISRPNSALNSPIMILRVKELSNNHAGKETLYYISDFQPYFVVFLVDWTIVVYFAMVVMIKGQS